jgi:hypothetical protein
MSVFFFAVRFLHHQHEQREKVEEEARRFELLMARDFLRIAAAMRKFERSIHLEVHGANELSRDFARCSAAFDPAIKKEIREAAQPVARDAEQLAAQRIRNLGDRWGRMRVGVTRSLVYVAPTTRATRVAGRGRPNLAGLLADRAMIPAVQANEAQVVERIGNVVDRTMRRHGL